MVLALSGNCFQLPLVTRPAFLMTEISKCVLVELQSPVHSPLGVVLAFVLINVSHFFISRVATVLVGWFLNACSTMMLLSL